MVFGEIVEPSTRALIDDDLEEYPEYVKKEFNWEGNFRVPADLNTLIFFEGTKISKLFHVLVLSDAQKICYSSNSGVQIYGVGNATYIISYVNKDFTTGEVIEEISEWLIKAKNIYAVISESISLYQNLNISDKPETLIRKLSNMNANEVFKCEQLESPNLISGLGADVLSYSLHTGLKSTLFVVYMDSSPLDSININPIMKLMKSLNLSVKTFSDLNPVSGNLYL